MSIYDFKCKKCDRIREDVALPISHRSSDRPMCCDTLMNYYITSAPMVTWKDPQIEPFRFGAVKGAPIVTSTRQRRDLMERNDLIDANDLYKPPSHRDKMEANAAAQESIDSITPDAQQAEQLQEMGLDSPDN